MKKLRKISYSRIGFYLTFLFVSVVTTSCVTNRSTRFLQNIEKPYACGQYEEYKLQPFDEVALQIYSAKENKGVDLITGTQSGVQQEIGYKIYADGNMELPYVGSIHVAGYTIRELDKVLTDSLKNYLGSDIHVKTILSKNVFYVIGESGKGEFRLPKPNLNIFEALAISGNLDVSADRKHIKIMRKINGKEKFLTFDIRSKDIVDSEYYYIQPNDMIFVPRSKGSFFKITSFSSFLGVITSSVSFVLLVVQYATK